MKTKFTTRQIWLIAYPIMLTMLMEQLIGMTDTAFLGRLGGQATNIALSASALGNVYYLACFLLGFGFSIGVQILIGRRNGQGDLRAIGPIFQQGTIFLLALGLFLFAFTRSVAPLFLNNWVTSTEVAVAMWEYLDWRIYSVIFGLLAAAFRAFYVGTTNTRILTLNGVVMILSNVVLNYGLIFGRFGLPAMGIAGAGIASSVAELVSLLFFAAYTWWRVDWRQYRLFGWVGVQWGLLRSILSISVWSMIQQLLTVGTWFFFFIAIEDLGIVPLAVANLVRSVGTLFFVLVGSVATTANTLTSNMLGAGQARYVISTVWQLIRLNVLLILPVLGLVFLFPEQILLIFTDNRELIHASVPSLWVLSSSTLLCVPAYMWFSAISGTGNTRPALILEASTLVIYVFYVWYVVVHHRADVAVCWTAEYVYWIFLFCGGYTYMRKANWRSKKI